MPAETIMLWSEAEKSEGPGTAAGTFFSCSPSMTFHSVRQGQVRASVIVCPGGGYEMKADHEGLPVAEWLNSLGIEAYVLDYRVRPDRYPAALLDAGRAIDTVRKRVPIARKVGILGFSAGGHLAASAATLGSKRQERPDFLILGYPVISMDEFAHLGSFRNLLGDAVHSDLKRDLSLQNRVSSDMPPTFLWHTADDAVVPVQNSLLFANALAAAQIPFACHLFPHGEHGLGLAQSHPEANAWPDLCNAFMQNLGI